jgi:hypothetical protein
MAEANYSAGSACGYDGDRLTSVRVNQRRRGDAADVFREIVRRTDGKP